MMKKQLSLLLFILSMMLSINGVNAQTVSKTVTMDTAGQLATLLGADKNTVTDLTVKGNMNDADFATIRSMTALQSTNIKDAVLPNNTLPNAAFMNCTGSFILPDGLMKIGNNAFDKTIFKSKLIIPKSVESIGPWVFTDVDMGMVDLQNCKENLTSLGCTVFRGATVPNNILDLSEFSKLINLGSYETSTFYGMDENITIILPKNMETISNHTFKAVSGNFILPENLKTIGRNVFENATVKNDTKLPEGLTTIDFAAFKNAKLSHKLIIPSTLNTIGQWAFAEIDLEIIDFEKCKNNLSSIHTQAFMNSTAPDNTMDFSEFTKITALSSSYNSAFHGMDENITIILPKNMTKIPDYVFKDVSGYFILPENLKSIGMYAFEEATIKNNMMLPEGLVEIQIAAFRNAKLTHKLVIPKTLQSIRELAFVNVDFNLVDINKSKESLSTIGYQAFSGVNVPNNTLDFSEFTKITTLGSYAMSAFKGMDENITIILPKEMEKIPDLTFKQVTGNFILPKAVKSVGISAFEEATIKNNMILPEGLVKIERTSFNNVKPSQKIVFPSSLETIDGLAFHGVDFSMIDISNCTEIKTMSHEVFKNTIMPNNTLDLSKASKLTYIDSYGISAFQGMDENITIILPKKMTRIPNWAFHNITANIILPDIIKIIGSRAFLNAVIKNDISLSEELVTIEDIAFQNATLSELVCYNPVPPTLGSDVFLGMNKESCTLHVPFHSVEVYKNTPQWKEFFQILPLDAGHYAAVHVKAEDLETNQEITGGRYAVMLGDSIIGEYSSGEVISLLPGKYTIIEAKAPKFYYPTEIEGFSINARASESQTITFGNKFNPYVTVTLTTGEQLSTQLNGYLDKVKGLTIITENDDIMDDTNFTTIKTMSLLEDLNLSEVSLPSNAIKEIYFTGSLNSLTLPNNLKEILANTFRNFKLNNPLEIPATLEIVYNGAFENATIDIDFSKAINFRAPGKWGVFTNLNSAKIDISNHTSNDVRATLGAYPFSGFKGEVVLPNHIDHIGYDIFKEFEGTTIIPEKVKSLGDEAFRNAKIKTLTSRNSTPPSVAASAFTDFNQGMAKCILYVPYMAVNTYKATNVWKDFFDIQAIPNPHIRISVEGANNEKLTTGVYRVSKDDGIVIGDYPGESYIWDIKEYGTYTITEVTQPAGHSPANTTSFTVTLDASNIFEVISFTNTPILNGQGTLILDGREKGTNLALYFGKYEIYNKTTNQLVGSIKFEIGDVVNGYLQTQPIVFNNLPFGIYSVVQISAPTIDHQLETSEFTFYENDQEVSIFSKVKSGASLTIQVFNEGTIIPTDTKGWYTVVNWNNEVVMEPRQPGNNGEIRLTDLDYGWYVVRETQTPSGYMPDVYKNRRLLVEEKQKESTVTFYNKKGSLTKSEYAGSVDLKFETSWNWDAALIKSSSQEMQGVRVGEYLWTNQHLQTNALCDGYASTFEITKAQIDRGHQSMVMFNYHRPPREYDYNMLMNPTYWAYGPTMEDVNEYYGGIFRQAYFGDWYDPDKHAWSGAHRLSNDTLNYKVRNALQETEDINIAMYENGVRNHKWRLPLAHDLRQLVGMCGDGSVKDLRKYLSWAHNDPNAPSIVKAAASAHVAEESPIYNKFNYFDWFMSPTQKPETNKYGFNLVPAPMRSHEGQNDMMTHYYDLPDTVYYTVGSGDFIGLNQIFRLRGSDGSCLGMTEMSNIIYDFDDFANYPIRFCRPLTDDELGYRLWINIQFSEEEELMRRLAVGELNPNDVRIEKTTLNQKPSGTWYELERGYLRGTYVQYILDNPSPVKNIPDILQMGYIGQAYRIENTTIAGIWKKPFKSTRRALETADIDKDTQSITIYPNPVQDYLNIDGYEAIESLHLFDAAGNLVIKTTDVEARLDMSMLAEGVYILKLQTADQIYTHKVIKK